MFKELKDKKFWKKIRENPDYKDFIDVLKNSYETNKVGVYESIRYSLREDFYKTGIRKPFENLYFQKREYLSVTAMLSLIYWDNDEYLKELKDIIWNICDEPTWILPAHVDNVYENFSTYIDLFSAETGFALTEICYILEERLEPVILERTKACVKERVIDIFLKNNKFHWEIIKENWAAVCAGSVGGILMYNAPDIFEEQKERLLATMDVFLDSYPNDGTCLEGHAYWLYGFGYYCLFADLLYRYSNGEINLMQGEKVKNIACYMQRNFLKGNSTISFSDGTRVGCTNVDIQYFLHKTFPEDVCILPKEVTKYRGVNIAWYSYLRGLIHYNPTLKENRKNVENLYLPEAGQFIANNEKYSFAIKAGNNDEPHNHNDIGSFIIADSTGQVFCDLGAGEYTKEYFGEERYEYLCNSSLGHSVPIVDGQTQKAGEEYFGEISCPDNETITVEMSNAYGIEKLRKLTRNVTLKDNSIVITDNVDSDNLKITERFVTTTEPETLTNGIKVGNIKLLYDTSKVCLTINSQIFKSHYEGDLMVYCIDFTLEESVNEVTFEFII